MGEWVRRGGGGGVDAVHKGVWSMESETERADGEGDLETERADLNPNLLRRRKRPGHKHTPGP